MELTYTCSRAGQKRALIIYQVLIVVPFDRHLIGTEL